MPIALWGVLNNAQFCEVENRLQTRPAGNANRPFFSLAELKNPTNLPITRLQVAEVGRLTQLEQFCDSPATFCPPPWEIKPCMVYALEQVIKVTLTYRHCFLDS